MTNSNACSTMRGTERDSDRPSRVRARVFSLCAITLHAHPFSQKQRCDSCMNSGRNNAGQTVINRKDTFPVSCHCSRCIKHPTCLFLEGVRTPLFPARKAFQKKTLLHHRVWIQKNLLPVQSRRFKDGNKCSVDLVQNQVSLFLSYCQASTGRKMVNVFMLPSPIIKFGRIAKVQFSVKRFRSSMDFPGLVSNVEYGSSNIRTEKRDWFHIGTYLFGLEAEITSNSQKCLYRGGRNARTITHPIPLLFVLEILVVPRFISASIPPSQIKRRISKLAVGGVTSIEKNFKHRLILILLVIFPSAKEFGIIECIEGLGVSDQQDLEQKDLVLLGFFRVLLNNNSHAGCGIP